MKWDEIAGHARWVAMENAEGRNNLRHHQDGLWQGHHDGDDAGDDACDKDGGENESQMSESCGVCLVKVEQEIGLCLEQVFHEGINQGEYQQYKYDDTDEADEPVVGDEG